jgi:hypothetical protein
VPTTGDDADLFRIEPEMGALIANTDFSQQTKQKFVITVAATDGEFRTTAVVKVSDLYCKVCTNACVADIQTDR